MRKFLLLFTAAILLMTGCKKNEGTATLRIQVNDFTITEGDFPSKDTPVEDYSGVKAITLAFYDDNGAEAYKVTQLRADASTYTTFGSFEFSLNMGNYTMVVLGYGSVYPITLTSPTSAEFTLDKCRETFAATQTVNVTNTNTMELSVTLSRIVAKVAVQTTDNLPEGIDSVCVTLDGGARAFNPTTGLATNNNGLTNAVVVTSPVGTTATVSSYLFLASDQQNVNVTLNVYSNNIVTFNTVVNNVPLQRNKVTTLRGKVFTSDSNGTFSVDTEWLDPTIIDFGG